MAEPITIAQLIDASEDANTLALFSNADAATQVPRRLADPIETLEYWRNYMSALAKGKDGANGANGANGTNGANGVDAAITSLTVATGAAGTQASVATGGTPTARTFALTLPRGDKGVDGSFTQKSYTTYALMDADKVNIPANTSITVTNDTDTTKNGMYTYNGTVFTKSAYDPLTQAKSYTDTVKADTLIKVDKLQAYDKSFLQIDKLKTVGSLYTPIIYGRKVPIAEGATYAVNTAALRFLNPLTNNAIIYSIDVYSAAGISVKIAEVKTSTTSGFDVVKVSESIAIPAGVSFNLLNTPLKVSKGSFLVVVASAINNLRFRTSTPVDDGGYISMTWDYANTIAGNTTANSGSAVLVGYAFEVAIGMYDESAENLNLAHLQIEINKNKLASLFKNTVKGNNYGESDVPTTGEVATTLIASVFAKPMSVRGVVDYTQFYAMAKGNINIVVLNKLSSTQYEIVSISETITASTIGLQEKVLNVPLSVEVGQYVGWYQSAQMVYWAVKTGNTTLYTSFSSGSLVVGSALTTGGSVSSDYRAQIKINVSTSTGVSVISVTQSEYDAITVKNPNAIYAVG